MGGLFFCKLLHFGNKYSKINKIFRKEDSICKQRFFAPMISR